MDVKSIFLNGVI
jgi:hypothetical protein